MRLDNAHLKFRKMERTKTIYLPNYKDWFDIIKQDGNRVLIDFYGKQIVYNILGVEGIQII